jgi:nicotinamidase-related amidase
MTRVEDVDLSHTALLLMDCQSTVLAAHGPGEDTGYLAALQTVREASTRAGCQVIHVVTAFRAGHPEVAPSNVTFSGVRDAGMLVENAPGTGIHPLLAPVNGDLVVTKRRVSAFAGSDLDMLLRAKGITTLVLAGVITSGVVLSTTRAAADLDYRLVVLRDGCYDPDNAVHEMLMDSVLPMQAEVLDIETWLAIVGNEA